MLKVAAVVLLLLGTIFADTCAAEPPPKPNKLTIKLDIPKSDFDKTDRKWCGDLTATAAILSVSDGVHRPPEVHFCAAYGDARAKLFTDKGGRDYVILEHGEGQGTNAMTGYVEVYRASPESLDQVMKIMTSWGTAPVSRFEYDYRVSNSPAGGLQIELIGKTDEGEDQCCIPKEKHRVIRVDYPKP